MNRDSYGECDGCGRGPRTLVATPTNLDGLAWQHLCNACWDDHIDELRAIGRIHPDDTEVAS